MDAEVDRAHHGGVSSLEALSLSLESLHSVWGLGSAILRLLRRLFRTDPRSPLPQPALEQMGLGACPSRALMNGGTHD